MAAGDEIMRLDMIDKATWEKVLALADKSTELLAVLNNQLPTVTADDNGKVLSVVEGEWAAADLPSDSTEENLAE